MSSLPQESIEERFSQLEKEVASLKDGKKATEKDWLSQLAGTANGRQRSRSDLRCLFLKRILGV